MAKISIATLEKSKAVPPPEGRGEIDSRALLTGDAQPIHLRIHRLGPGAEVMLAGEPADVALFVWKGSAEAGGACLGEKSSVVIEYGASLRIVAGEEGVWLAAFNRGNRDAAPLAGGHVHLLPNDRVPRSEALGGTDGVGGAIHATSQCSTCRVWLHENSYAMADKETAVHSHSEDEVIFVHSGSIRLGSRIYGPGTALAVAANAKYSFHSGPDGLAFVNFRGSSPTYLSGDGKTALDEAALWHGLLGDPEYLEPASM